MIAPLVCLFLLQAAGPEALSERAAKLAQERRFAEAETLWKEALAISPGLFSATYNLGYMYYSLEQYADAEPWLARAVRAKPEDFNARYLLGAALAKLDHGDDALRQWRSALALRPGHVKLMEIMAVEYSKGRYFREAAAVAERALALKPDDPAIYLLAIKARQDAGEHPRALALAEDMVRKFPGLTRANFEFGFELHRAGRLEEALVYLEKAMAAAQTYEEPFFFYGEIRLKEGRTEEAVTALRRAIDLKPDYMAARVTLARALMAAGRHDEAKAELLHAAAQDPRHPQPHLLLSQLYFRMGDEKKAADEKEISLRLRRENPQAMESPQGRPFRP